MADRSDRSSFVTRLAWLFIVPAGFMTFTSLVQMVVAFGMFSGGELRELMGYLPGASMPGPFKMLTSHMHIFFVASLVVPALALAASVGLLKRKNWARIVFIVVLCLGIGWNVLGIILFFTVFPLVRELVGGEVPDAFETIFHAVQVSVLLLTVATAVLFGWIIRKLVSPAIRAEFRA